MELIDLDEAIRNIIPDCQIEVDPETGQVIIYTGLIESDDGELVAMNDLGDDLDSEDENSDYDLN